MSGRLQSEIRITELDACVLWIIHEAVARSLHLSTRAMKLRGARYGNAGNGDWQNRVPRHAHFSLFFIALRSVRLPSAKRSP
jgi:hypothetical protein